MCVYINNINEIVCIIDINVLILLMCGNNDNNINV